jgi:hypothetical protein
MLALQHAYAPQNLVFACYNYPNEATSTYKIIVWLHRLRVLYDLPEYFRLVQPYT